MREVITAEQVEISIHDEHGSRTDFITRYNVANPELNIYRQQLQDAIVERRNRGGLALLRPALAGAVSACDEFASLQNPTIPNRQHFAMCLKGAKLSVEDANRISGITDYMDRMAALTAASAA